jgi:integrase/recombinase XerD
MTHLRKMMLEELERRNYAQTTIDCYLRVVAEFSLHFHRPPNQLGQEHIRQYQAHLFGQRKLAPSAVTQHLAALRFFYIKTLRKPWSIAETPYPKKVQRLPIILSPEEVTQLIDSALTPFHRILLMTLYATGGRRAELARLKITDIDRRRMVIHIQGGKGRKDRDVMLSPKLLEALREYWRGLRRKPTHWLFTGGRARIPVIVTSAPRPPGTPAKRPPGDRVSARKSIPIPCATALPLICWRRAPICAPFRYC